MTYKINGSTLDPQPTTGKWLPRELIGLTGDGRPIYEPTRQFEITFNLLNTSAYSSLQTYFDSIAATGTVIVDLPRYEASTYTFRSYTGCYIQEPQGSNYFTQHKQEVRLLVTNIVT